MISALIGFWLPVRAIAADDATRLQNVLLILTAIVIVLLVVALWAPSARPFVLGAAGGLVVGAGVAMILSVAFGAGQLLPAAASSTNHVTEGPTMPRAGVCDTVPS